jgi:hypothetical protein
LIVTTKDSKYLFTSDFEGDLQQYDCDGKKMVKHYGKIHNGHIIAMVGTPDSKWLFSADSKGVLIMTCVYGQKVVMEFGQMHLGEIHSMCCS